MFRIIIMQNKRLFKYILLSILFILLMVMCSNKNNKNDKNEYKNNNISYLIDDDYNKARQYNVNIRNSINQMKKRDLITPVKDNSVITDKSVNKIKEALNIIDKNITEELIIKILSIAKAMQVLGQLQDNLPRRDESIDLLANFFNNYKKVIDLFKEQAYKTLL